MRVLNASAPSAVSGLIQNEHRFSWKWRFADYPPKNGLKVFSCFSGGGGSTMGYKLAGFDVVGNLEIDFSMMETYRMNHCPKYSYLADIRDFSKLPFSEFPDDLKHLDVLDGSPPCSVFSTAGSREKAWGKQKRFREGQKAQTLDDLFDYFIEAARVLQPKVVVAENVTGLIKGNAKGYVNRIISLFDAAGYDVQLFQLNAAYMGVPQRRERVFFIGRRKDLNLPKLAMSFHEEPILFGEIRDSYGVPLKPTSKYLGLLKVRRPTDKSISDIYERVHGKSSGFNNSITNDNDVCGTIVSGGMHFRGCDGTKLSVKDYICAQTFPQDYDFGKETAQYVCGMSVPPVMMAQIATKIKEQWFNKARIAAP